MKFGERDWAEVEAVSLPAPLPAMLEDLDDDAHFALRRHIVELMWEVERLREQDMHQRAEIDLNATLRAELDRLRDALSEVREVYAGSEGIPVGETAAEAYVVRLIEQMYRISVEALDTKEVRGDKSTV